MASAITGFQLIAKVLIRSKDQREDFVETLLCGMPLPL